MYYAYQIPSIDRPGIEIFSRSLSLLIKILHFFSAQARWRASGFFMEGRSARIFAYFLLISWSITMISFTKCWYRGILCSPGFPLFLLIFYRINIIPDFFTKPHKWGKELLMWYGDGECWGREVPCEGCGLRKHGPDEDGCVNRIIHSSASRTTARDFATLCDLCVQNPIRKSVAYSCKSHYISRKNHTTHEK